MNFINKLKRHGISRLPFFILVVLWSIPYVTIYDIFVEAGKKDISLPSSIYAIYILVSIFLAIIVYLRMINARSTYKLAIFVSFIPLLNVAAIIQGLWYKTDNEYA